jgi:hypothetical protein
MTNLCGGSLEWEIKMTNLPVMKASARKAVNALGVAFVAAYDADMVFRSARGELDKSKARHKRAGDKLGEAHDAFLAAELVAQKACGKRQTNEAIKAAGEWLLLNRHSETGKPLKKGQRSSGRITRRMLRNVGKQP